ncbi:hypothetical protein BJ742DRAFT_170058 [Cladochytrium replicatum]|nr:hypothetical protein BJ742DRAFT_170058 [Cladochytrium replicatum]
MDARKAQLLQQQQYQQQQFQQQQQYQQYMQKQQGQGPNGPQQMYGYQGPGSPPPMQNQMQTQYQSPQNFSPQSLQQQMQSQQQNMMSPPHFMSPMQQQMQNQQMQNHQGQHQQQKMTDDQFDRIIKNEHEPQRITLSNDRLELDSDEDSDSSINMALSSKEAFFDLVNQSAAEGYNNGPRRNGSGDDFDLYDDMPPQKAKRGESLADFLRNTGPEVTGASNVAPVPQKQKKRGTGIFRFGKKGNNAGGGGGQGQQMSGQMGGNRPNQQSPRGRDQDGGGKKYTPLSVAYDPFQGKENSYGPPNGNNNSPAMMAARNVARRSLLGEESRSVQQLAEVLVTTSADEPHPAKFLGPRQRRPESIMMEQQMGYNNFNQRGQGGQGGPQQFGGPQGGQGMQQGGPQRNGPQQFPFQQEPPQDRAFKGPGEQSSPQPTEQGGQNAFQGFGQPAPPPLSAPPPPQQPPSFGGPQQPNQGGGPPNFNSSRTSSLDPRVTEQLRAMSFQASDNPRISSLGAGQRLSSFAGQQQQAPYIPQIGNIGVAEDDDLYDDEEEYEDMDSDSDGMDEEVLRNTDQNAMFDAGLAEMLEFIPRKPYNGPPRKVEFAPFVQFMEEEEIDDDEVEEEEGQQQQSRPAPPAQQPQAPPPPGQRVSSLMSPQQQQQRASQFGNVSQDGGQGATPVIKQRMSSLQFGGDRDAKLPGSRASYATPPPQGSPRVQPREEPEQTSSPRVAPAQPQQPPPQPPQQPPEPAAAPAAPEPASDKQAIGSTADISSGGGQQRKKKVRHVQIQTRGPQTREIQLQTDAVATPHSPTSTSSNEQTEALAGQVTTLQTQLMEVQGAQQELLAEVGRLRDALERTSGERDRAVYVMQENQGKFDKLSEQAFKKIKEMLEEQQVMEIEIQGLRSQVNDKAFFWNVKYVFARY